MTKAQGYSNLQSIYPIWYIAFNLKRWWDALKIDQWNTGGYFRSSVEKMSQPERRCDNLEWPENKNSGSRKVLKFQKVFLQHDAFRPFLSFFLLIFFFKWSTIHGIISSPLWWCGLLTIHQHSIRDRPTPKDPVAHWSGQPPAMGNGS